MKRLTVPEPVSGGIVLSYKCTSECRHCMYACSPRWKSGWMDVNDLNRIMVQLSETINKQNPLAFKQIRMNYGLHLTGGEPFLNFELLLKPTQMADELDIPGTFVETSCFWCTDDACTRERLQQLRHAVLDGILVSVNLFILEYVPFEKTEMAIRIGREVFRHNVTIYQEFFYHQFKMLNLKDTISFEDYLQKAGPESLSYAELIPMGRAPYKLAYLYDKYPGRRYFGKQCKEELTRPWHVHIDNCCNYMTGYCGGISLGDARNLNLLCHEGVNLDEHPILEALATDVKKLYDLGVEEFGYEELSEGYVSKCHLCLDIRKHIVNETNQFKELTPKEFYTELS